MSGNNMWCEMCRAHHHAAFDCDAIPTAATRSEWLPPKMESSEDGLYLVRDHDDDFDAPPPVPMAWDGYRWRDEEGHRAYPAAVLCVDGVPVLVPE